MLVRFSFCFGIAGSRGCVGHPTGWADLCACEASILIHVGRETPDEIAWNPSRSFPPLSRHSSCAGRPALALEASGRLVPCGPTCSMRVGPERPQKRLDCGEGRRT